MVMSHPSHLARLFRLFFIFSLVVIILSSSSGDVSAADGAIFVNGSKLSTLYRYKKNGKYYPIQQLCNALGLHAVKNNTRWTITNSWQGEITVSANRESNIIERDGVTFAHESFWTKSVGLEIVEQGNQVCIYNRILKIEKHDDGLLLTTAAPIEFSSFDLDNPARTVYDFANLSMGDSSPLATFNYKIEDFDLVRVAQFEIDPHKTRLVVDHACSPTFKPISSLTGINKNVFWIGADGYIDKTVKPVPLPDVIIPSVELISYRSDGSILFSGFEYNDVRMFHLMDGKPFRAVFDLIDCHLPFKDEKAFKGSGSIQQIRVAQNDEKTVRVVVDLKEPLTMTFTRLSRNELALYFVNINFNNSFSVLIDAGHGGKDPGAIVLAKNMNGISAQEKDINLKLAFELGRILTERGVKVYYTRTDDRFIELPERRDMATRMGVDLFVSIHCNSTPKQPQCSASGPEVYYHYSRDAALAREIWNNMSWRTQFKGRGAFFSRFLVTMNPTVPAVIIESGYMSNLTDLAALIDPNFDYGKQAMLGVAEGITKVFGKASLRTEPIITEKQEQVETEKVFRPRVRMGSRAKRFSLEDLDIKENEPQQEPDTTEAIIESEPVIPPVKVDDAEEKSENTDDIDKRRDNIFRLYTE